VAHGAPGCPKIWHCCGGRRLVHITTSIKIAGHPLLTGVVSHICLCYHLMWHWTVHQRHTHARQTDWLKHILWNSQTSSSGNPMAATMTGQEWSRRVAPCRLLGKCGQESWAQETVTSGIRGKDVTAGTQGSSRVSSATTRMGACLAGHLGQLA
jgi:hypothetical protein